MIAAVEEAICARLRSAAELGILGYSLNTVETYGGQLDDMESLRRVAHMLPACFVCCLGERLKDDMNGGRYRMEGRFAVIVAAKNAGNEQARRHGSPGAVGTYQIRRDVRTLLSDQRLGLEIDYLVPEGTHPFFTVQTQGLQVSILSVEFSTTWIEYGMEQANAATAYDPEAGLPAVITPEMFAAAQQLVPVGEIPTPRDILAAALGVAPLENINGKWLQPAVAGQLSVTFEGSENGN